MNLEFFNKVNIVVQPILGILTLANTFFLTKSFIDNAFAKKDKFYIKVGREEIFFMNKGKYPIIIKEISVQYLEEEGITGIVRENFLKEDRNINAFDNSIIEINPIWFELKKMEKILYICFRLKSESGRNYDSICLRLLDKNRNIITTKRRLKKEIFFLNPNQF